MRMLTKADVDAGDLGKPGERVQLHPELCVAHAVLRDGRPSGEFEFCGWSRDGVREWVLVEPPQHDA